MLFHPAPEWPIGRWMWVQANRLLHRMREGGEGLRIGAPTACSVESLSDISPLRFLCFGVFLRLEEDAPMEKAGDTDAEGLIASLNMMSTLFVFNASGDVSLIQAGQYSKCMLGFGPMPDSSRPCRMSFTDCRPPSRRTHAEQSQERLATRIALETALHCLWACEAVNCKELMKSFGWDTTDAFTQHDAQDAGSLEG